MMKSYGCSPSTLRNEPAKRGILSVFDLSMCVTHTCFARLLYTNFYYSDQVEPTVFCVARLFVEYLESFGAPTIRHVTASLSLFWCTVRYLSRHELQPTKSGVNNRVSLSHKYSSETVVSPPMPEFGTSL